MKGIIVYKGKYGATAQYARWLSESTGLPLLDFAKATPGALAGYDLVILGSSVYVGNLVLAKWLDQNANLLIEKKVLLFIVCGATADNPAQQQQLLDRNLGRALRRAVKSFFLPGRCIISGLSWKDRLMLKIGAWMEKDPKNKAVMKAGFDNMARGKLDQLVNEVRGLMNADKEPEATGC